MIFSESKVYGPNGAIPVKTLKKGDTVWSWQDGTRWVNNRVKEIHRGQSKTAYTIWYHDGSVPMHLRCSTGQLFRVKGAANLTTESVRAGTALLASHGANVFRATVGPIEKEILPEPQETFRVELVKSPRNILVDGFLLRA